mgnify:CR=1 FL=1
MMYQNYLITGATGFLGSAVVQLLLAHGCRVLALVMNNDPLIHTLPKNVTTFFGDLTDQDSLRDFFAAGGDNFCVLHCAGLVSISSKPGEAIYAVNVQGTQNILNLCQEYHAAKLVYVSSVHAIPEKPAPETIMEPDRFAPDEILGDYGKSKAMATALVLEAAQSGLNASVVLPSGILGIGEPLIYGVTLPLGKPFLTACLGAGVGGAFIASFGNVGATSQAVSGILMLPVIADQKWFIYAGGLLLSYAAGFVLTYFFGVPKEAEQPAETLEELEMQ